jgi:hypothetical protein
MRYLNWFEDEDLRAIGWVAERSPGAGPRASVDGPAVQLARRAGGRKLGRVPDAHVTLPARAGERS